MRKSLCWLLYFARTTKDTLTHAARTGGWDVLFSRAAANTVCFLVF